MREGYYTDVYFNHARETLLRDGRHPRVVMQVFQKQHAVLGGMDEAIAILKLCADDWDELTVHALYDGDEVGAVGDGDDDRGRLHALRAPRDPLPGRARPEDARLHERPPGRRGGAGKADPLLPRPPRPPSRADRRRLRGPRRRARSASPPTHRHRGGAVAASAPFRTRSSPPTVGTRCSRRRSSPSRPPRT